MRAGDTQWVAMVKKSVCPGCRHNRYNQGRGPALDGGAEITTDKCWMLEPDHIAYDRKSKSYSCSSRRRG